MTAWAEDRAPWRHDLSADPVTKTEGGRHDAALSFPSGLVRKRQIDAHGTPVHYHNSQPRFVHFTLNQHTPTVVLKFRSEGANNYLYCIHPSLLADCYGSRIPDGSLYTFITRAKQTDRGLELTNWWLHRADPNLPGYPLNWKELHAEVMFEDYDD